MTMNHAVQSNGVRHVKACFKALKSNFSFVFCLTSSLSETCFLIATTKNPEQAVTINSPRQPKSPLKAYDKKAATSQPTAQKLSAKISIIERFLPLYSSAI